MFMEAFLASFALSLLNGLPFLVSYINNDSFEHPLSQEDELRYLQLLRRDPTNSDVDAIADIIKVEEARNRLIEHNMRLVAHIVKQFGEKEEKNADLFSIGMIGLIKAIDSFNPNIGAKLSTYASTCIRNEILMTYRKDHSKSETSLYSAIGKDNDGNELRMIDSLFANNKPIADQIENEDNQRILRETIEKLPLHYRQVLQLRYGLLDGLERSQQVVADSLKISRSYVSRLEKKAIQLLIHQMREL